MWCCRSRSLTIACVNPARDKFVNAARKVVTEFIDIGRHVMVGSIFRGIALQSLQLLQGLCKAGYGSGGSLRIASAMRLAAYLRSQRFKRREFLEDGAIQAHNGVGKRWERSIVAGLTNADCRVGRERSFRLGRNFANSRARAARAHARSFRHGETPV